MSADRQYPPAPRPARGQVLFMWHALIPGLFWNMMHNAVNAHPAVIMTRWAMSGGWRPVIYSADPAARTATGTTSTAA